MAHLRIVASSFLAIALLALALSAAVARAPGTTSAEGEETFELRVGLSKYVHIGGREVIITCEAIEPDNVRLTCSVDGEEVTKVVGAGDVIFEHPDARIILENIIAMPVGGLTIYRASFKVMGDFKVRTWRIMTVDSGGEVGAEPKLVLDSKGHPHIAYNHWEKRDLKYARWTGSGWKVETVDWKGSVGRYPSIALDAQDRPHISYMDTINYDVKYASWDGRRWVIERVDSENDVGFCVSMAFDSKHRPHLAYWDFTSGWVLKHARWTGGEWGIEIVENVAHGWHGHEISIAIDGLDRPHISYCIHYGVTAANLRYAKLTENGWAVETVDNEGLTYRWVNMAIDNQDHPHIVYYTNIPPVNGYSPGEMLEYARWTGVEWRFEAIDNVGPGSSPPGPSIALDSKGYPHIAYCGPGLNCAHRTGNGWKIEKIEYGWTGATASIIFDENDLPHIAYYDMDKGDLKYATLSEAIGPVEPRAGPKFIAVAIVILTIAAMLGVLWRRRKMGKEASP